MPEVSQVSTIAVGGIREDARQAGGLSGHYIQRDCITSHCGRVDPGEQPLDSIVVDQVSGFRNCRCRRGSESVPSSKASIFDGTTSSTFGSTTICQLKAADFARGSDGLGERFGGVGFVEERLALQVAGLDVVAINNAKLTRTPARANSPATADPVAPQPMIVTWAAANFRCPSSPMPRKRI